ncbi:MAG: radical SAM protein, partial [Anaerolineae bacterium]|nr:radical SAM protein [Anaerolineae bacterium]
MDPLHKLYVEITSHCNLSCQMCVQRVWNATQGDMPLATFARLMDNLAEFPAPPIIHLGGYGEPMHHPDFLEIVRLAKATGARVEVTSNGTLLTPPVAEALIELGLDRLVVSIDGVTEPGYASVRVHSDLGRVITNLRDLFRRKLRVGHRHSDPQVEIAFVAMQRNVADLPLLPSLATRTGAWHVNVSNVIPHTPAM